MWLWNDGGHRQSIVNDRYNYDDDDDDHFDDVCGDCTKDIDDGCYAIVVVDDDDVDR